MNVAYAEIGITTNFSFLRGGSDPRAYVHEASRLNIPAIGIADPTLAGVVRAIRSSTIPRLSASQNFLIGARLVFIDGTPDNLALSGAIAPPTGLCQLLTHGKRGNDTDSIAKGECHLRLDDLLEFSEGQLLVLTLPHRFDAASAAKILQRLKDSRADGVWLAASLLYRGDDRRRLARLHRLSLAAKVPLLAANEVLYHHPAPLQDVLTCIREGDRVDHRQAAGQCGTYLKPAHEMARLFRNLPKRRETMRFADRITPRLLSSIPVSRRAGAAHRQDRATASGGPDMGGRRAVFRRRIDDALRHFEEGLALIAG
jgi:error-prone DNA polymerase